MDQQEIMAVREMVVTGLVDEVVVAAVHLISTAVEWVEQAAPAS
jgi:enoyl-CoA hydratase/carnithine racemase